MPIVATKTGIPDDRFYITRETAENFWVESARVDPAAFITYMTGGKKPLAPHQLLWLYYFLNDEYDRVNLIGPRESAKTFTAEYALAWFIGNYPWHTNQIVCDTFSKATRRLANIRSIIGLERYKQVFPWIQIDNRRDEFDRRSNSRSEFTIWSTRYGETENLTYNNWKSILHSHHETRDPTLSASGITSGGAVGARISGFLIADDIMTLENSQTIDQRDKVSDAWNSKFEPAITTTGRVWSVSTRWHEDDQCKRWDDLEDEEGKKIWKTITIPCYTPSGDSYWPEQWPLRRLQAVKNKHGLYWFAVMYECNPKAGASNMFTKENLLPLPSPLPIFRDLVLVADLGFTMGKKSDPTVVLLVARDFSTPFNYFVLDGIRGKFGLEGSFQEIVKFKDEKQGQYGRIKYLAVEKQGMQTPAAISRIRALDPTLDVLPVSIHMRDKTERAKPLGIKAQAGQYFVNHRMKIFKILSSEHINYGAEKHDDCLDAADLLLQLPDWNSASELSSSMSVMELPLVIV